MAPNDDWKNRIHDAIWDGRDGLIVRVDRLEQSGLARKERWALYIAAMSPLMVIAPYVLEWLRANL